MNINCIICSDSIIPSAEIFTTPCGHLFHYACLIQWIERSKTCPQCRNRTTEGTIHRVYFNVSNTDHIVDDVATLQSKLDNIQFQLTLKEKDVKNWSDKYKKMKVQNVVLREELSELENKTRSNDSVVHALKDQISFFKSKSKERDRLSDEVSKLKLKLKEVETVQTAINGTREDLNDILRTNSDPDSLVILAATLKKALLDTEKKKMNAEVRFKKLQAEVAKYKSEISSLQLSNDELAKELEMLKANWGEEKDYLKNMVLDMHQRKSDQTIQRIVTESPINSEKIKSPSVAEKVNNILTSNSPYLPVKSSIMNIDYDCKPATTSIFKKAGKRLEPSTSARNKEMVYIGLGGHSKPHLFPGSNKRQMASSTNSSTKLRKLNSMSFVKNNVL